MGDDLLNRRFHLKTRLYTVRSSREMAESVVGTLEFCIGNLMRTDSAHAKKLLADADVWRVDLKRLRDDERTILAEIENTDAELDIAIALEMQRGMQQTKTDLEE